MSEINETASRKVDESFEKLIAFSELLALQEDISQDEQMAYFKIMESAGILQTEFRYVQQKNNLKIIEFIKRELII